MRKVSLITTIFILALLLSSCSAILGEWETAVVGIDVVEPYGTLTINQESDISLYSEDSLDTIADRDNSSAELTVLFAGTFTVGIDIPPGRYVITADSNGNFFVRERGSSIVNTILTGGDGRLHPSGVPSITTDIKEGQEIEISGINNVTFTPAVTQMSTVLTAGDWIVGLDIPPGIYNAFPTYEEAGNFFVRSARGRSIVNEILNTTERAHGVERVRVNLEEGQRIQMHNISSVTFEQP